MGFRCPLCKLDFGNDKKQFDLHISKCQNGLAADFVQAVRKTCESRQCEPPIGDKEECEFYDNGLCKGESYESN